MDIADCELATGNCELSAPPMCTRRVLTAHVIFDIDMKKENKDILMEFIKSKSFEDHSDRFIYDLKEYDGDLLPFAEIICEMVNRVLYNHVEKIKNDYHYIPAEELIIILLRLYEQAESRKNHQIINMCLDMWDKLLENNISTAKTLTDLIMK